MTDALPKRTIVRMKILADTNTFLAVALGEPDKDWLTEVTVGADLAAPAMLPHEIGNALSALVKRKKLRPHQATDVWDVIRRIPVELVDVDIRAALGLAVQHDIYAYDAYFLQCALQLRCPLLTLDRAMRRVAGTLGVKLVEKP